VNRHQNTSHIVRVGREGEPPSTILIFPDTNSASMAVVSMRFVQPTALPDLANNAGAYADYTLSDRVRPSCENSRRSFMNTHSAFAVAAIRSSPFSEDSGTKAPSCHRRPNSPPILP
jgi:hypothetical protein